MHLAKWELIEPECPGVSASDQCDEEGHDNYSSHISISHLKTACRLGGGLIDGGVDPRSGQKTPYFYQVR